VDQIETISVDQFANAYKKEAGFKVLDVRKPGEWNGEHIDGAQNFPLDYINQKMGEIDQEQNYYLHCRSGYRSTVAASILKSRAFNKLTNVQGAFTDIIQSEIPTTDFVCPTTLSKK